MSADLTSTTWKHTVLVVDYEQSLRGMVAAWLAANGYHSLQAQCTDEARRCLQENEVDLVALDINMPGESGLILLAELKADYPEMPVLMLTANGHTKSAIEGMSAGACGYLTKPIQKEELLVQVTRGLEWRQLWLERCTYTQSFDEKVVEQTREIRQAHEETIHRLVAAAMCRNEETEARIVRTGLFSEVLARAAGCSASEVEMIRFAAPMHDIGKIGIPETILQKPGRLTEDEFEVIKTHTTIGAAILSASQTPVLQLARDIALNHHERWDGKGYPSGLAGDAIPLAARILSIVDVYDALTHDRIYGRAFPEELALSIMKEQHGTQFDPVLLTTFFTVLDEIHDLAMQNPDEASNEPGLRFVATPIADVALSLPTMVTE